MWKLSNKWKQPSGYPGEPFDPRDVYEDQVFAGDTDVVELPKKYLTKGLEFEGQGVWPFCTSMGVTKFVEYFVKKKFGITYNLSQALLFFLSGGTRKGSGVRANLEIAKNVGLVSYAKFPMPSNLWEISDESFNALKEKALTVSLEDAKKIDGYVRVNPDIASIKRAILKHGMVIVGVAASGGWWTNLTKRSKAEDNHIVLAVGWEDDVLVCVFDSLQNSATFNGYHNLAYTYTFNFVYAVTELPENWKEIVAAKKQELYGVCLNHYGQPRRFWDEQTTAVEMRKAFEKFKNQSVLEAAGKFWNEYTNMVVYGGYSFTDVINDCYNWRRTGKNIFDFNQLRSEYKK